MPHTMILAQLDKQTLYRIVSLVVKETGIRTREGLFRYTVEDVKRQLTFGGDFTYGFGDFFKIVFVRAGTRRNKEDFGKYDTLFHLSVELDNVNALKKDDKLYDVRKKIAEETQKKLEDYLEEIGPVPTQGPKPNSGAEACASVSQGAG